MSLKRKIIYLFIPLFLFISTSSAASDILLNGTDIYLTTGEPYGLYQGYVLNLRSVSNDGSVWLQLLENDSIVRSDIVHDNEYFIYNKTNRTIISIRMEKIYSSSSQQNLVAFSVYQFIDPDMPVPDMTIIPENTINSDNNSPSSRIHAPGGPVIWILGVFPVLIFLYILRKLW